MQSNARIFCSQRAKAALALVVSNEEHSMMSSDWLRVALLLSEISCSVAWEKMKLAYIDDIVFQMICNSVVLRLNVVFLI